MGVGGQRHAPAASLPGKTRYPLCRRLSGPQGRSGRVRKILPPIGIRSPDRPVRSESLYRLSYRGPQQTNHMNYKLGRGRFLSGVLMWTVNMGKGRKLTKWDHTNPEPWVAVSKTYCRYNVIQKDGLNFVRLYFLRAKNLVLHSSHFALNWRCCTAVR